MSATKTRRLLALCVGLTCSLATVAQAQIFQSTFPGGGSADAARGGVLQTIDGGTISVGESRSFGAGDYDVYVVKTDRCGSLEWSATYNIGGNDFGRKIRATADSSYIIVGSTENLNNCCVTSSLISRPTRDIFLLKIAADGSVQWAKTYGGLRNEEGNDVQLTGNDGYVVAGSTQSFGNGRLNGYLIRTNLTGNVVWARTYGENVEFFNSCAVLRSGQIVAVGASASFTDLNNIFMVRTLSDGSLATANIYPTRGTSVARHVIQAGPNDLLIAGYISLARLGTQKDGYLLRIDSNGAVTGDHAYSGAEFGFDDELAEVRMVTSPFELRPTFVVTGYLTRAPGGFGGRDLYLAEMDNTLNPIWNTVHGGVGEDEGYSLAASSLNLRTPKFTANGVTTSFTRAGDAELYLIQGIRNGRTGCNDAEVKVEHYAVGLANRAVRFCTPVAYTQCDARVAVVYNKRQNPLCTSCDDSDDLKQMEEENGELSLAPAGQDEIQIRHDALLPTAPAVQAMDLTDRRLRN